jgi:hypothetical protein
MRNQPNQVHAKSTAPLSTGERVAVGGKQGVVVAAFTDGFHLVRLDETQEITGAHFSQLVSIEHQHSGMSPDWQAGDPQQNDA